MGHRMSALPTAQFCGLSPRLSASHGAGRAAAISSAFHAMCADAPEAKARIALLTNEERSEIAGWKRPSTISLDHEGVRVVLDYASAEKELAVALDAFGQACAPDDPDAATVGHLDFAWVHFGVAYVADIKKSLWTTSGPESLQLTAYGFAYALARGCHSFVTGLWIPSEGGEWLWSEKFVVVDSPEGEELLARVLHAATNDGETNSGQHCRDCYARLYCPEFALAAATPGHWMEAGGVGEIDGSKAAELILQIAAIEDIAERAKKNIQERVRRGEIDVRDPKTNKRYLPVHMPGRAGMDMERLRSELGERLDGFMRRGQGYQQFRWVKG